MTQMQYAHGADRFDDAHAILAEHVHQSQKQKGECTCKTEPGHTDALSETK